MVCKTIFKLFLLIVIPAFVSYKVDAKAIDGNIYRHKMQLIDSLSFYNMQTYDTLYHISAAHKFYRRSYHEEYYGWVIKRDDSSIQFIKTNGERVKIEGTEIDNMVPLTINDSIISIFSEYGNRELEHLRDFGKNYLLCLWLYKKGQVTYSATLWPKNDTFYSDQRIIEAFGIIYFDAMLSAYTHERNYQKAIQYGHHLGLDIFKNYEYQNETITLTHQLEQEPDDFKTFYLPDSAKWAEIKQTLNRKEQIMYLADRLRLINCIQPGQPAGISYTMYQFSIPVIESRKVNVSYENHDPQYEVVNPYTALLQMKLSPMEVEILLPCLLSDTYIPTYTYFRDFTPERKLHKLSWVARNLIYAITDRDFLSGLSFDAYTPDEKKTEVEKIRVWCEKNATVTREARTIELLKTTHDWTDFQKAMATARQERYDSLLPIIAARFYDFSGGFGLSEKAIIAKTMYELGNENYAGKVKNWNENAKDEMVKLWCSMFLLKYDKTDYESAFDSIAAILKTCDGVTYYPYAMDLLLSMNDKRALQLAEGILDKPEFPYLVMSDSYLNFIKKMLLLKSDRTFECLSEKLQFNTSGNRARTDQEKPAPSVLSMNDFYVLAVDKLRGSKPEYPMNASAKEKMRYREHLNKWFAKQYKHLKAGESNELHLDIVPAEVPVFTIDSPHY